jgi:hypothetical protein
VITIFEATATNAMYSVGGMPTRFTSFFSQAVPFLTINFLQFLLPPTSNTRSLLILSNPGCNGNFRAFLLGYVTRYDSFVRVLVLHFATLWRRT